MVEIMGRGPARHSGMLLAGIQTRVALDWCVAGFRLKACRNDELDLANYQH
jgi:hypothetical protein